MRTSVRMVVAVLAALIPAMIVGPAHAVTHQAWSLSLSVGYISNGDFTSNLETGYWHISGTIRDRYAGDDCTRVILYEEQDSDRMAVVKNFKVCGGGSYPMDYADYALGDRVIVKLCQDYWGGCRSTTQRTLYLVPA